MVLDQEIKNEFETLATAVKVGFDKVDERFNKVDERFDALEGRVTRIEATMVTKSYLDDKLADLKGSLIVTLRKEDEKVDLLIDLLYRRNMLKDDDVRVLHDIAVFPRPPVL
ncbi:MAG: hypothetical protein AAB633_00440 [Patescibacteria group bacterium]